MTDFSISELNQEEFDFASQVKIGEGGCGTVHEVKYGDNTVVVKKPKKDMNVSKKEVSLLSDND